MEDGLLSLKWSNYKITFFENLKILREKSNYTDATLAVEGKFYPVHKVVMSTCSEYFSDIFERTLCKSPVIVLKDVRSHDIESLLDYMYLGEVSVNQNDLASLLKTAEGLRIKGFAARDANPTNICESSTSSNDDAGRDNPPPKRRRHDSKNLHQCASSPVPSPQMTATALDDPAQSSSIPPYSSSNTQQDASPVVKVEMEDAEESNTEQDNPPPKRQRHDSKNIHQPSSSPDLSPQMTATALVNPAQSSSIPLYSTSNTQQDKLPIVKVEMDDAEESNTEQDEPPLVKIETDDAENQEERFRRENNYEGGASSDRDPLGNFGSDLSKTQHEPVNSGNTSLPGPSLQQSDTFSVEGVMSKIMDGRNYTNSFKTNEYLSDSPINQNQTNNPNESVLATSVKENQMDKPKVSLKPITQNQLYKGSAKVNCGKEQIRTILHDTTAVVPAIVVAAVNDKGSAVYMKIFGNQAIQMVKCMKPKQGKVGLIKVTHSGQIYTVRSDALRMTQNIPGIPDRISPNESTELQPGLTTSNIGVTKD